MNSSPRTWSNVPGQRQLFQDVGRFADGLGCGTLTQLVREHCGLVLPCVQLTLPESVELLFIGSPTYPGHAPVVLVTIAHMETWQLQLAWDVTAPAQDRLDRAVSEHIFGPAPFRRAYGPRRDLLLTEDANRARSAGWRAFITGLALNSSCSTARLFERCHGLISTRLQEKRVFVVGLGSGGSYVVDQFARHGVRSFDLLDPDVVEGVNLSRSIYSLRDVGESKAAAMARHVLNINPAAATRTHAIELASLGAAGLSSLVQDSDLVVALTDDPLAQAKVNQFCYWHRKPCVFAAMYRGAQGGEVIICVPGKTPCLECATGGVRKAISQPFREMDYGTARLNGEIALGADIQHLDTATVKLGLSMLLLDAPEAALSSFAGDIVEKGGTYLCMGMTPNYWIFPSLFESTPGQYAFQSAWFRTECQPDCTICGDISRREDPTLLPLRTPRFERS